MDYFVFYVLCRCRHSAIVGTPHSLYLRVLRALIVCTKCVYKFSPICRWALKRTEHGHYGSFVCSTNRQQLTLEYPPNELLWSNIKFIGFLRKTEMLNGIVNGLMGMDEPIEFLRDNKREIVISEWRFAWTAVRPTRTTERPSHRIIQSYNHREWLKFVGTRCNCNGTLSVDSRNNSSEWTWTQSSHNFTLQCAKVAEVRNSYNQKWCSHNNNNVCTCSIDIWNGMVKVFTFMQIREFNTICYAFTRLNIL